MRWKVTSRRCRWKPFTARCVEIHEQPLTLCVASVFQAMAADGQNTLMKTARKRGVNSTGSGLQFRVLTQGEGRSRRVLTAFACTTL